MILKLLKNVSIHQLFMVLYILYIKCMLIFWIHIIALPSPFFPSPSFSLFLTDKVCETFSWSFWENEIKNLMPQNLKTDLKFWAFTVHTLIDTNTDIHESGCVCVCVYKMAIMQRVLLSSPPSAICDNATSATECVRAFDTVCVIERVCVCM